jgi:hypothetical protein
MLGTQLYLLFSSLGDNINSPKRSVLLTSKRYKNDSTTQELEPGGVLNMGTRGFIP